VGSRGVFMDCGQVKEKKKNCCKSNAPGGDGAQKGDWTRRQGNRGRQAELNRKCKRTGEPPRKPPHTGAAKKNSRKKPRKIHGRHTRRHKNT